MKKFMMGFILIAAIGASVFYKNITSLFAGEKPVNKELNVSIASAGNYSSAAYENALASVHITIFKINGREKTIVWDKIFDTLQLKKYPDSKDPFVSFINIPDVLNNKEKLIVTYTITYNTRGSIFQLASDAVFTGRDKSSKLEIHI